MLGSVGSTFSHIYGWVSIASWIVVYSPQIYENYLLQSGEGLSVLFVVIWLLGDLCNLGGAILGELLPTVIILALYYTFCDLTLLVQIYYYRWKRGCILSFEYREYAPLLPGGDSRLGPGGTKPDSTKILLLRYGAATFFVFATGVGAWWISESTENGELSDTQDSTIGWQIQVIGWMSACLYLGARIPQIAKNIQTRCDGLSPALFFFAIFGNVTYVLSICAKSMDKNYLIKNASWLAGSGLTVFLDVVVLAQFFYYHYYSLDTVDGYRGEIET